MLIRAKIFFFFKNSIWVSKNAEFHADSKSVEKVYKNIQKKVISKNMTEIYVRQTCFAYNIFFVHFLNTLPYCGTYTSMPKKTSFWLKCPGASSSVRTPGTDIF